jgi:UDP-2-acetamido-3-amino-2,3-dideoxy-glucuronate N-acetyltransferase
MSEFREDPRYPDVLIHESAYVDEGVEIGEGTKLWHFVHVLSETHIGCNVTMGQNVMAGPRVRVGEGCKIQNNVSLYEGVELEDNVFCGPSCVFTNVINPRSTVNRKSEFRSTLVREGTTIGANATILCGISIGRFAFIGAGAVVLEDVPDHALVVGNPAHCIGWMSCAGERLGPDFLCPADKSRYRKKPDGGLELIDD